MSGPTAPSSAPAGGRCRCPSDRTAGRLDTHNRPPPRLIFVTPSCQWPLGLVMPMDVRLGLLQLAEKHDAWIIEDDYDSEYRFSGHPIPAMQGLDDSGRVIYVGTMSKTMFPSLRVAYIVVPAKLVEGFKTAVSITGQYPPLLIQVALADFIGQGFFAKHLRRMRRLYARRQRDFVAVCRARLDEWLTVNEIDTGMQVIGRFRRPFDDGEVLAAALRHGVDFSRLSTHYRHSHARARRLPRLCRRQPGARRASGSSACVRPSRILGLRRRGATPRKTRRQTLRRRGRRGR